MSDIKGYVNELAELNKEIKRRTAELFSLRSRKTKLENDIAKFIEDKKLPGVKHNNLAVLIETKEKRTKKKSKDKIEACKTILQSVGVVNSERVLKQLEEARKGDSKEVKVIKFVQRE
jgi:hypothetical protein